MSPYITHADLGGRPGFGVVILEPEGDLFHAVEFHPELTP